MSIPLILGDNTKIQYQDVGITTLLSLREGKTVVVALSPVASRVDGAPWRVLK